MTTPDADADAGGRGCCIVAILPDGSHNTPSLESPPAGDFAVKAGNWVVWKDILTL